MGSALSNTCCFSRVSTTMRVDPHVRYRRDNKEKKKRMNCPCRLCKIQVLTPSLWLMSNVLKVSHQEAIRS